MACTVTLKLLYNAIILPYFDYSDIVYDTATGTNKAKLQLYNARYNKWCSIVILSGNYTVWSW